MTEFFTQTMATLDAEYLTLLRAEQKPSLEQLRAFHRTCETLFAHLDKDLKPMQMHFNDDLQQKRLHFIYFTYLELALDEERMKVSF